MSSWLPFGRFFGGRLAQRLFALFVAAALVPLALSGWLSSTAVNDIAEDLSLQSRAAATRQTSRQVFDRLMDGKTLLAAATAATPATANNPAPQPAMGSPPVGAVGLGRVFRRLVLLREGGVAAWSSDPTVDLVGAWNTAATSPTDEGSRSRLIHAGGDAIDVQLRTEASAGRGTRVLLGASQSGTLRWLAEFDPRHLWGPLEDAGHDVAWTVANAQGRVLARFQGDDFPVELALAYGVDERIVEHRAGLFLGGEFGADDWVFAQRSPRPQVRWHGQLLAAWLGLVAVGTLLGVALVGYRQIRRTLQPLEQLTEGTRALAAGAQGTRVAICRDDEIGTLAGAFNQMAERIEDQFIAMEGLAAFDRDILSGEPIEQLAARMLRQLASLYAGASAAVSWRDPSGGLMRAEWRAGQGATAGSGPFAMSAEQAAAFDRWSRETRLATSGRAVTDASGVLAGLGIAGSPGAGQLVVFPLRENQRTIALVSLGLPAAMKEQPLQPARDLRDRLAVAFATRSREQELLHRALHDGLTGLSNRDGLHRRLDELFGKGAAPGPIAVLFIDLDHFKDVNDSRGHEAGDELLCQAGERLRAGVPADALVARQGGDEFAIVLHGADEALACELADRTIRVLRQPFELMGGEHVLGASIGIALSPAHGRAGAELLRRADIALYAAKAEGRGKYALFTTDMDNAARDRVQLLAELRAALAQSEFVAHYQPRVRSQDGRVTSAEALIRWQHPRRGLLPPGAFIGLAESSGLIDAMGHRMLDFACAQMAAWRRDGVPIDRVSVNVSPQQLVSGELLGQVRGALNRHSLSGDCLELEVTESLLVGDVSSACEQLSELRRWGVSIALDDFGTGYSSMSTLRQLPIDVMKIDRSFVVDLGRDDGAMAVATAIVAMARSLGLKLVAEGIETEAQAEVLRAMGCHELQGYLFSRPVPAHQLLVLPGLRRAPPKTDVDAARAEAQAPSAFSTS